MVTTRLFSSNKMPTCPFIITILCDAQSAIHYHAITINHANFHFLEIETLFTMEFFITFSLLYTKIDQLMLEMNFKFLIVQLCRKYFCTQSALTRNLKTL
jgi:hypothetical protein